MNRKKTCRLCLACTIDNFLIIEETIREILNILLLKVNVSISEEPVVCKSCTESVATHFDFKAICIYTEDSLFPFVSANVGAKVDLAAIYFSIKENIVPEDCNICRLCIKFVKNVDCVALDVLKETQVLVEDMFAKCIPEVNLEVVKQPVICITCMENLKKYFNFLMSCLNVEEKINDYVKIEGTNSNGYIELSNVFQLLFKYVSRSVAEHNQIKGIERTSTVDNGESENVEIKDKNVEKIEEPELIIKDEESEDEKNNNARFQGSTLIPEDVYKHKVKEQLILRKNVSEVVMHQCEEWDYKTKYKCHLDRHVLTHTNTYNTHRNNSIRKIPYSCEICTYKTKWKYYLERHMLIHKSASEITMYSCGKCTYKSKRKSHLERHMLIHKNPSEITMYSCEICTYKTKHKSNLKKHMLIHKDASEATTYPCGICTYKSKRKDTLKLHMLTHKSASEIRTYSCGICTRKLKHRRSLKRHTLIHKDASEITMYSCGICTYKTKWKSVLKRHIILFHKDASETTTYSCEICTYKTKLKSNLKQHMVTHKNASELTA